MDAGVEEELMDCCTARSARVGFVVTIMITSAGWLGLHVGKSVTIHNYPCRQGRTRYERQGG